MPVGSTAQDLRPILKFRKYAAQHVESWYKYILKVRECEVRNGDLRLVIGHDKASSWGMAAFYSTAHDSSSPLYLSFKPTSQSSTGRSYGWDLTGTAEVKNGPDPRDVEALRNGDPDQAGEIYENQCLFLRTINPKLQDTIWKSLLSELGHLGIEVEDMEDTARSQNTSTLGHSSAAGSNRSQAYGSTLTPIEQNIMTRYNDSLCDFPTTAFVRPTIVFIFTTT